MIPGPEFTRDDQWIYWLKDWLKVVWVTVKKAEHLGCAPIWNLSRECQVSRKTVEGYVEILEDLLLGFRVPVFTRRAARALA